MKILLYNREERPRKIPTCGANNHNFDPPRPSSANRFSLQNPRLRHLLLDDLYLPQRRQDNMGVVHSSGRKDHCCEFVVLYGPPRRNKQHRPCQQHKPITFLRTSRRTSDDPNKDPTAKCRGPQLLTFYDIDKCPYGTSY